MPIAPSIRWTPVAEFAEMHSFEPGEIIARIQRGSLNGVVISGRWYILDDLVTFDIPDRARPELARLRIACHRDGNRLGAGCGTTLDLNLQYGDEIRTTIGQLFGPENVRPEVPITLLLGGQEWVVDPSLHGDLLGNLVAWQIEVELGDLLVPPTPVPLN